jgi:hypothetical protein
MGDLTREQAKAPYSPSALAEEARRHALDLEHAGNLKKAKELRALAADPPLSSEDAGITPEFLAAAFRAPGPLL